MDPTNFPNVNFTSGPGPRSDSCGICMMEICSCDTSAIHLACQNAFHHACFANWSDTQTRSLRSTTCPICRAELNTYQRPRLPDFEIEARTAESSRRRDGLLSLEPYLQSRHGRDSDSGGHGGDHSRDESSFDRRERRSRTDRLYRHPIEQGRSTAGSSREYDYSSASNSRGYHRGGSSRQDAYGSSSNLY